MTLQHGSPLSISATTLRCFIAAQEKLGLTYYLPEVAAKHSLPMDFLEDSNNRLPLHVLSKLTLDQAKALNEPLLGLKVTEQIDLTKLSGIKELLYIAHDVKDALETFNRYYQIYSQMGHFALERDLETTRLIFKPSMGHLIDYHQIDCSLLTISQYMRHLGGDGVIKLHLTHHIDCKYKEEYKSAFGMPIEFGMKESCFILESDWLNHRLEEFEPPTPTFLEHAERRLKKATGFSNIEDQVQFIVKKMMAAGNVSGERVSSILSLSYRTFHRHLKNRNTSFKDLLQSSRISLAIEYLIYDQHSINEIASRLGYTDSSNFLRAFKSWTGMRPLEFRQQYMQRGIRPFAFQKQNMDLTITK